MGGVTNFIGARSNLGDVSVIGRKDRSNFPNTKSLRISKRQTAEGEKAGGMGTNFTQISHN